MKLIILDKLAEVKQKHGKVLQELLMDVLRALVCPTLDIRKKTLEFAMDLVNPRNIDEVVSLLKKEIQKTQSDEAEQGPEYRRILIKAIHSCALRFPDVACSVVHALMEHLGDANHASALDVINFVAYALLTTSLLLLLSAFACYLYLSAIKSLTRSLWLCVWFSLWLSLGLALSLSGALALSLSLFTLSLSLASLSASLSLSHSLTLLLSLLCCVFSRSQSLGFSASLLLFALPPVTLSVSACPRLPVASPSRPAVAGKELTHWRQ